MSRRASLAWSLLALTVTVAVRAQEEEKPFPLPKPAAPRAALDDEGRAAIAQRLCTVIDAGDAEAIAAALGDGANPNVGMGAGEDTTAGRTPLIHAVLVGRADLVDLLVARGARLDNGDAGGHTPLMYAALLGNADLCKHLLRIGARPDAVDKQGGTAADQTKGRTEIDELLAAARKGHDAVLAALAGGDFAAARQAVDAGASPNANDGATSLLLRAVAADDDRQVADLLALGCRPDLLHVDGFSSSTPLGVAADKAGLPVLQRLLAAGPGQAALDGALSEAASSERSDRKERVRRLLAAGANPNVGTLLLPPALPMATMRGDLETMALLLQSGADRSTVDLALVRAAANDDQDLALRLVTALLAIGADVDHDEFYANALGAAAEKANVRVMALLLPGASKDTLNTAIGQATRAGNADGLQWLLVKGAANVDLKFKAGIYAPPLIEAIEKGHVACVARLLEAGADANQEPEWPAESPLTTAVKAGHREIVEQLLAAGAEPLRPWGGALRPKESALDVARAAEDQAMVDLLERHAKRHDAMGALLVEAGLHFEDAGDCHRLRFDDDGSHRGQIVWIRKAVDTYGALAVHEVFSLCYDAAEPPDDVLLRQVFLHRYAIGGLVLEAPSAAQEHWRIRFRIEAPADVTAPRLATYLQLVQSTADALEREISPAAEDRL